LLSHGKFNLYRRYNEVESGKTCAKAGPKKVKGIGKGIGDKIDEFLNTGTMVGLYKLNSVYP
jgi:DNA polymerase/3'-5' exonuclease PolX